jgi:hypothetical protein
MKYGKLGALGAVGVALGLLALYLVLAWVSTPSAAGGIDRIQSVVAYIAIFVPICAIAVIHLVYARILWAAAQGKRWAY